MKPVARALLAIVVIVCAGQVRPGTVLGRGWRMGGRSRHAGAGLRVSRSGVIRRINPVAGQRGLRANGLRGKYGRSGALRAHMSRVRASRGGNVAKWGKLRLAKRRRWQAIAAERQKQKLARTGLGLPDALADTTRNSQATGKQAGSKIDNKPVWTLVASNTSGKLGRKKKLDKMGNDKKGNGQANNGNGDEQDEDDDDGFWAGLHRLNRWCNPSGGIAGALVDMAEAEGRRQSRRRRPSPTLGEKWASRPSTSSGTRGGGGGGYLRTRPLQVQVQTRFIELDDDYLERIGLGWGLGVEQPDKDANRLVPLVRPVDPSFPGQKFSMLVPWKPVDPDGNGDRSPSDDGSGGQEGLSPFHWWIPHHSQPLVVPPVGAFDDEDSGSDRPDFAPVNPFVVPGFPVEGQWARIEFGDDEDADPSDDPSQSFEFDEASVRRLAMKLLVSGRLDAWDIGWLRRRYDSHAEFRRDYERAKEEWERQQRGVKRAEPRPSAGESDSRPDGGADAGPTAGRRRAGRAPGEGTRSGVPGSRKPGIGGRIIPRRRAGQ